MNEATGLKRLEIMYGRFMKIKPVIFVTFEMKAPTFLSKKSYIRAIEQGTDKVLLQKEYTRKGPVVKIRD